MGDESRLTTYCNDLSQVTTVRWTWPSLWRLLTHSPTRSLTSLGDDGKVDMAEFMALELLRLGKIDPGTLDTIKREFKRLDKDNDGTLKKSEILLSD